MSLARNRIEQAAGAFSALGTVRGVQNVITALATAVAPMIGGLRALDSEVDRLEARIERLEARR